MTNTYPVCLLPLDERPVNTRYPEMLAAIAGIDLRLPPPAIRGLGREPADLALVTRWLREEAPQCRGAIVSSEFLGYGNLINARISQDSAADVIARLSVLTAIDPVCPVHAFSLITRVANANNCVEEPLYWLEWGTRFYRYARLSHRDEMGDLNADETAELAALEAELPQDLKADWLTRRLRNHVVTLALFDLAARGQVTSLLITSDDTAAYGFPSRERDWLKGWPRLIGSPLTSRVSMYPGADEVCSALLAKLVNARDQRTPRVWIEYSRSDDTGLIAPYEDRAIRETVLGQIHGCGCIAADTPEESDFVLGVATVSPRRTDWRPEFREDDRATRTESYLAFLNRLAEHQAAGRPVALADVAYPNGSDPLLAEMLLASEGHALAPGSLIAYGAWNTAGNTLGVVVAQGVCSLSLPEDQKTVERSLFLTHRYLEDYGYQTVIRREARDYCEERWGRRDPNPESEDEVRVVCEVIEAGLNRILTELRTRGIGEGVTLSPGSVRLPWRRTFEVDFELIGA
jgi:hypothetical protein